MLRTAYFKRILFFALVSVVLASCLVVSTANAEVRLATWNVMRMNDSNKDFEQLAEIVRYFDFVALQEVMSEAAASSLANAVIDKTKEDWQVLVSHPIGRGTYKESYAFLWRESKIEFVDSAVVYIDDRDVFEREPVSARFRAKDEDFTFIAANIHVIFGNNKSRREPELRALRSYWHWLHDQWPDDPIFLFGDFNMTPDEDAWYPLLEVAYPVVTEGATTLSTNEGQFANLYDNIWIPRGLASDHLMAGTLNVPQILDVTHQRARESVSDHIPVFLEIDTLTSLHDRPLPAYNPQVVGSFSQQVDVRAPIIGNMNSRIYHWPGCPGYEDTSAANMIGFSTRDEAEAQGYRAARNC